MNNVTASLVTSWLIPGEVALCQWNRQADKNLLQPSEKLQSVVQSFLDSIEQAKPVLQIFDLSRAKLDQRQLTELKALLNELDRNQLKGRVDRALVITGRRYWSILSLQSDFRFGHHSIITLAYNWQLADRWMTSQGYEELSYPGTVQRELKSATTSMRVLKEGRLVIRSMRGSLTVLQAAGTLRANLEFGVELPRSRKALIDVRNVDVSRSELESQALMDQECGDISMLPVPNRQVFLCKPEVLEPTRFLCDWMGTQGMVALACTDIETASVWLDEDPGFIREQLKEIALELEAMDSSYTDKEAFHDIEGDSEACFVEMDDGHLLVGRLQGKFSPEILLNAQKKYPSPSDEPGGRSVLIDVRKVKHMPPPHEAMRIFKEATAGRQQRKTHSTIAILCRPSQLATSLVWSGYFAEHHGYTKPFTDIEKACDWLGRDSDQVILALDRLTSFSAQAR